MKLKLGSFAVYATLALVCAKVSGIISIRWLMVFTPLWLWLAFYIFLFLVGVALALVGLGLQSSGKRMQKWADEKSRRDDKREM